MEVLIETQRFFMRRLTPSDATEKYLNWLLAESTRRFIVAATETTDLSTLRDYIELKSGRPDVLFLGIFLAEDARHLGNIKFDPIDTNAGYAVIGILLGDVAWRGRGVATEVISASVAWLNQYRGISEFVLHVNRENVAAISAYEKAGFRVSHTDRFLYNPVTGIAMVRWI